MMDRGRWWPSVGARAAAVLAVADVVAAVPLGRTLVAEAWDVLAVASTLGADPVRSDATAPVLVLGGEPERMALGLTLPGVADGTRQLVASADAARDLVALGGDCDAPRVRCIDPVPATTRGEARLAAQLASADGWDRLVVITSWWHVHRAARHLAACLDPLGVAVTMVPAGDPTVRPGPGRLVHEAVGALDARLRPECGDRRP